MFVKNLRPALATLLVVIGAAAILWLMGRPLTYRGGLIELWGPAGAKQSQMLLDWYSASHIVHGFLFYGLLHLAAKRWKPGQRLLAATLVEAAWEIVENSPVIIDRYREAWSQPGAATATINYYRAAMRRPPGRGRADLAPVTAPTLVIWGERDRYLAAELAEPDREDVPALERVVRLPEASHWVQHDEPDRVSELLIGFFKA